MTSEDAQKAIHYLLELPSLVPDESFVAQAMMLSFAAKINDKLNDSPAATSMIQLGAVRLYRQSCQLFSRPRVVHWFGTERIGHCVARGYSVCQNRKVRQCPLYLSDGLCWRQDAVPQEKSTLLVAVLQRSLCPPTQRSNQRHPEIIEHSPWHFLTVYKFSQSSGDLARR
ncbi:MAG: hypothetical protein ACLUNZ_11960 [Evtepia sp.]